MRRCMVVLAVVLAACGGESATEPPPPNQILGPVSLDIVSGDAQQDTVLALLKDPVEIMAYREDGSSALRLASGVSAQVTSGRTPVAGQVVNFVVIDSACGRPFAGSAVTDSTGRVLERWELGTKAGECRMEARAVDQTTGEAIVYDTATATVLPGAVDTLRVIERALAFPGETFTTLPLVEYAADSYGNVVSNPEIAVALPAGWTVADGVTTAPAAIGNGEATVTAGARQGATRLYVARDLSAYTWIATGVCDYSDGHVPTGRVDENGQAIPVDSATFRHTVEPLEYSPLAGTGGLKSTSVRMHAAGTILYYGHDGIVDTTANVAGNQDGALLRQSGDSLVFDGDHALVRTSDDPLTYDGSIVWGGCTWHMVAQ